MNFYEHGIPSESDEWSGRLSVLATTDLPVYAAFNKTFVDLTGESLNARAVQLGRVGQTHFTADYYEESDLRYSVLATLYHLNRILDYYVELTGKFTSVHAPGAVVCGNIGDPRVFYEIDAFLGAARRVYECIRKVLWKHYGTCKGGRWRSIRNVFKSPGSVPTPFVQELSQSWERFGSQLAEYRDCVAHYDPLTDGSTTGWIELYGNHWGMTIKLPKNPNARSRKEFDFATGPEALTYCHQVACHLVDVSESLQTVGNIRDHLENPRRVM